MIDFWQISANLLWILGLTLLLSSWSYAYYKAQINSNTVREIITTSPYSAVITIGLGLFCMGLAATDDRLWAQILWIVLGIAIVTNHVIGVVTSHRSEDLS